MPDMYELDRILSMWETVREEWNDTEYNRTESVTLAPLRHQTALLHIKSNEIYDFISQIESRIKETKVYI